MDSMRSLNRSLPTSTPARQVPPEQLLQAFRQAALSVTHLYKSAASDQESIRQAGYQDALDDLLKFLDREDLGLQDGEGWKVREWATARYDGTLVTHQHSESEDDAADAEQRQPSASPPPTEVSQTEQQAQAGGQPVPTPVATSSTIPTISVERPPPVFEFTASSDIPMHTDDSPKPFLGDHSQPRVDTLKTSRVASKHSSRSSRSTRAISQGAGSKRKLPFPDISDLFNVGFERKDTGDSGSGTKRSRHV